MVVIIKFNGKLEELKSDRSSRHQNRAKVPAASADGISHATLALQVSQTSGSRKVLRQCCVMPLS